MAGTAVTPSSAAGSMTGLNIGANVSASFVNSFRVAAVAERLATHVQPDFVSDDVEFFNLCLSLARYLFFKSNLAFRRLLENAFVWLQRKCGIWWIRDLSFVLNSSFHFA